MLSWKNSISYDTNKCHFYNLLEDVLLDIAEKCQLCIVLEDVKLILLIKAMGIHSSKLQPYTTLVEYFIRIYMR